MTSPLIHPRTLQKARSPCSVSPPVDARQLLQLLQSTPCLLTAVAVSRSYTNSRPSLVMTYTRPYLALICAVRSRVFVQQLAGGLAAHTHASSSSMHMMPSNTRRLHGSCVMGSHMSHVHQAPAPEPLPRLLHTCRDTGKSSAKSGGKNSSAWRLMAVPAGKKGKKSGSPRSATLHRHKPW